MNPSSESGIAERWANNRWQNFANMLKQVVDSNAFQQTHFPSLRDHYKWTGFDDFIQACPFTTKDDLAKDREANPPFGTNLTFPLSTYTKCNQTSGTRGSPMTWMDTMEDWRWMLGNWDRVLEASGVQPGSRCYFAFSFGPFLGFWTAYDAATQRGCVCVPGGGQSTQSRLHAILEHQVDYLFCTPTYAKRLSSVALEHGVDLSGHKLKAIIVAGETGGSLLSFREQIAAAWGKGVVLHDHYGMTEAGPVAYETPGNLGGLRIILDSYFPEVIDPETQEEVPEGEQGELVLTTLGRVGCPVFRYRTGDLVKARKGVDEMGLPTFDLIGGILGRVDEMVVVRGVNLYPSAIEAIMAKFSEVLEYQVVFTNHASMLEVQIKVEAKKDISSILERVLQETFSLRIPVVILGEGSLPRYEMKAKRWIKPE